MNNRTGQKSDRGFPDESTFSPGQRWLSENEPELGLGTVSAADVRYVDILFSSKNETRRYAINSAPLRRIIFKSGDTIADRKGGKHTITSVAKEGATFAYRCGTVAIPEHELADTVNIANPAERLAHGIVDTIRAFDHRVELLRYRAELLSSPVRGFVGGRIDLLPHQLFIAEKVSSQRIVRALLADETGLGKTIEACLILHRLLLTGRASRVLILVPEQLVHQWFVELLRRFNLTFRIFSPEYCGAFDPGTNPFQSDQLGICSIEQLVREETIGTWAVNGCWDMVVVDESHHLQQNSAGYNLVKRLSDVTKGLLLLTATPEQLGLKDHFSRLQLLDPHRYAVFEEYKRELDSLQDVYAYITTFLADHHVDLDNTDSPEAISLPVPERFLHIHHNAGNTAIGEDHEGRTVSMPLDMVIDLFGTGSIMYRNTRRNIAGFPERSVHIVPLEADKKAMERLRNEFESENNLSEVPHPLEMLPEDPRVVWLAQLIKKQKTEKFLVICSTKEKALLLQRALQSICKVTIAMFHEEMTILQSDRSAAWFSEENGARVLISSEMGSEGRNFQFCHSLVMFDLPMNPELVEQRIGRLDRIGQRAAVQMYVPYAAGSPQETLCRWFHEGVDAFSKNEPSAARVFDAQYPELLDLLRAKTVRQPLLKKILLRSNGLVAEYSTQMLNARDKLFEIASFHAGISREVIALIRATDNNRKACTIMEHLFEHYGVASEEAGMKKQALITEYVTDQAFPLPRGERPVITYDRQTALDREEVEFITIDHPMVRDSLDLYLSSDHATTAFALVSDPATRELALESIFVIDCIGPSYCDRFLPPTPLRIVVNHLGAEVTASYPQAIIHSHGTNGSIQRFVANRKAAEIAVPNMIKASTAIAAARAAPLIKKATETMRATLDREIARLGFLQKLNAGSVSGAVDQCLKEKDELEKAFQSARVRLEALRVIWRGPVKEKHAEEPALEESDD